MFAKLFQQKPKDQSRVVEVGWAITEPKASLIWDDPRQFSRNMPKPPSAKSVQLCPAAIDFDARHFVVNAPVDLHLRFEYDEKKQPRLVNIDGLKSTIRPKHLSQMVTVVNRLEWRHPDRPIIQVITPYIFMADETAYVNQLPPYLDFANPPWPGLLIAGRFPVHIWPRHLMWAFEWHDTSKDLIIQRGQPWFYVRFETDDPSRSIRLVEADITPEVQRYIDGISSVTNYVNRTYSLFQRAKDRRPKNILIKKIKNQ